MPTREHIHLIKLWDTFCTVGKLTDFKEKTTRLFAFTKNTFSKILSKLSSSVFERARSTE